MKFFSLQTEINHSKIDFLKYFWCEMLYSVNFKLHFLFSFLGICALWHTKWWYKNILLTLKFLLQFKISFRVCPLFPLFSSLSWLIDSRAHVSWSYATHSGASSKKNRGATGTHPGPCPTNDIWIEFEIQPEFVVFCFKMYWTDHNKILCMSRQCNCRYMCKILLFSVEHIY